jgi:hypothetical protein
VTQNTADISGDALLVVVDLKQSQAHGFWFFITPGCLCTELYRIKNLHPSGHAVTDAMFRETVK